MSRTPRKDSKKSKEEHSASRKSMINGQLEFGQDMRIDEIAFESSEMKHKILNEDGTPVNLDEYEQLGFPDEEFLEPDSVEKDILDLIRPGKFDIRNFHEEFSDRSAEVLEKLLMLQSNDNPLKKGGSGIAFRCDAIILANRQEFNNIENTVFDLISGVISSNPDDMSYKIYAKDAKQYVDFKDEGYIYRILKEGTDSMSNKPFLFDLELPNGAKRRVKVPWYSVLTYYDQNVKDEDENAYISFTPTPFFKVLMLSSTISHGAHYSVSVSSKIRPKYVKTLYYFLTSRVNYREYPMATPGVFKISFADLRDIVKYPKTYKNAEFKRSVLDNAVHIINGIAENSFYFDYELINEKNKRGRSSLSAVRIILSKKSEIEEQRAQPQIEQKEEKKEQQEQDVLVESILKGQGLTGKDIQNVIRKYNENHRDIVFLTQAITKTASVKKVRSVAAYLCAIMENGLDYQPQQMQKEAGSRYSSISSREYDYEELERQLLMKES